MILVVPTHGHLPSYLEALRLGWSPDNIRGKSASDEQQQWIERDPDGFLSSLQDPYARGAPVKLLDGSTVRRLPGITRWMWDGEFCGSIGFRWEEGTAALPEHVLGHIGFSVVPWKRGQGIATAALTMMLEEARKRGLAHVEITTTPDNLASRRVIEKNGGVVIERFEKDAGHGGGEALRCRIALA